MTGLLVWNCLDNVRFNFVCFANNKNNNVAIKVSNCNPEKLTKKFIFLNSMDLYGVMPNSDGFGKFESLYLATNHFVDVGYNRFSYRLYEGKHTLRVNRIGNLILIRYKSSQSDRKDDFGINAESSFCFILSQMQKCVLFHSVANAI